MRQVKSCYREPITPNLTNPNDTTNTVDTPLRAHLSDNSNRVVRPSVNFDFDYKFHFDSIFPPDQRDQDRNQNWNQTLIQSISRSTSTIQTKPNSIKTKPSSRPTSTKPSSRPTSTKPSSRPTSTKPNISSNSNSNLLSTIWNQTTSNLKPNTNWNQVTTTLKPNPYSNPLPTTMEQLSSSSSPPLSPPPNLTNTTNTNPYPSSLSTLPHTNTTYNNSDSSSMKLDTTPDQDQDQDQEFSPFRSPPTNPLPIVSPASPTWPSPPRLSLLLSPERPVNYDSYQLERDYSEYDYVQFSEVYPPILYSKISEDQFRNCIQRLNKIYRGGVSHPSNDILHFLLDTVTCYTYRACCGLGKNSTWEKAILESHQLISELNETLFHPVGLMLVDPADTAFLFLEIATLP